MNMNHPQKIACLAGSGVGPELMAEAARVLSRLNELHSLAIDEVHVPFAGEAMTRFGHPLPLSTRAAYRKADAILVASRDEPAVEALMADLDLVWRVSRVHLGEAGEVVVFGAVDSASPREAVERAFFSAAAKHGRLTAVGSSPAWRRVVDAEHARWGGMLVEHRTVGEALVRLRQARVRPRRDRHRGGALRAAHGRCRPPRRLAGERRRRVARGRRPRALHAGRARARGSRRLRRRRSDRDVADALAAARRGAARRSAARTLERAVAAATPNGTVGTRSVTDAVLALLPEVRTDVEMFEEVWAA